MNTPVKEKDTLEKIVADAIKKEQEINSLHPERNGYGMMGREADEFIQRIELIEYKLERAQKEKARTRKEKIRLIGKDMLYTRSPEDVVIDNMMRSEFDTFEEQVRDSFGERTKQVYDLDDIGLKQKEIAEQLGISQPTVHREIKKAKNKLKENYQQWREEDGV